MLKKLKQKYGWLTIIIFSLTYLFIFLVLIISFRNPLWSDEEWRADLISNNFSIPLKYRQYLAPISYGIYIFTKLSTFIYNNNFTIRLSTYIAFLCLPVLTYIFCRIYFNKVIAKFLVPLSVLSNYILEFSFQAKPYILDIDYVLVMFIIYNKLKKGKISFWLFLAITILFSSMTFASFFLLPCLFILMATDAYRSKNKKTDFIRLAMWSVFNFLSIILQYLYFLKPQITAKERLSFPGLLFSGNAVNILGQTIKNILQFFWITPRGPVNGAEFFPIFWTSIQLTFQGRTPIGVGDVIGIIYIIFFIYGLLVLYRHRGYVVLVVLFGMLGLEWIAALVGVWPFGDSRTNLFTTYLITLIGIYGAIKLIPICFKRFRLITVSVVIAVLVLTFPYMSYFNVLKNKPEGFGFYSKVSDEYAARFVAIKSTASDIVMVNSPDDTFGFQYYYSYSSYTDTYINRSRKVYYQYDNSYRLPVSDLFLKNNQHNIWVIDPSINTQRQLISYGYKTSDNLFLDGINVKKYEPNS